MISITNRIASDRNISVWVVPETVPGQIAYPGSAHLIGAFDIKYPTQNPEYTNSNERAQTRDVLNRCQGAMPAGEWGFSTYCRPKGVATVPEEGDLLEGLTGVETVGGSDVVYSLALQKTSYSIWFLVDHSLLFAVGATIGEVEFNLEDCSLTYQWSGGFMRMGTIGTEVLSGDATAAGTTIPVVNTDKFTTEGRVILTDATGTITDDNGGAGYTIDSISDGVSLTTTETIATGQASGGFVAPFDPGGSLGGNPLETRTAVVEIGGVSKPIIDFSFNVVDTPEYLTREKTPSGYPVAYAETQREISGEISLAFRRDDADEFKKAIRGDEQSIKITVGDLTGYTVVVNMPRCKTEIPTPEEEEPIVQLVIPYTALATTGEDSFTIQYK